MDEREKAQMGAATLDLFCKQFGEDVYSRVLLEILFEGLMNEEIIFVFGEQGEEGNQTNHSASEPGAGECTSPRPERTQPPPEMGTGDLSDYP